jgi:hypothetical protein
MPFILFVDLQCSQIFVVFFQHAANHIEPVCPPFVLFKPEFASELSLGILTNGTLVKTEVYLEVGKVVPEHFNERTWLVRRKHHFHHKQRKDVCVLPFLF